MQPERIGQYRILDRLGEGGMGVVYRAEHLVLHRPVALKLLSEALVEDTVARQRLLREAQAASQLNHPNIATVYEIGEDGGRPFIAMEFVEGQPLSNILHRGALSPEDVVRIGTQVAEALEAAHQHGIVHRDIKPGNILVCRDGKVKVVDFGLALHDPRHDPFLADPRDSTEADRLTQTGFTAGTISHMSPEQARGEVLDGRSDIFSLGVVLYEALTGEPPFEGANPLAIAGAILHEAPRPIREINPSVPPKLEEIVMRCLEKRPEHRPASAGKLREALELLAGGRSAVHIRRVLGRKPRTRKPVLMVAGVAAFLAIAFVLWQLLPTGAGRPTPAFSNPEARRLYSQALEYERRGYTPDALNLAEGLYRKALELEPDQPAIRANLARVLVNLHRQYPNPELRAEARRLAEDVLSREADHPVAGVVMGRLALLEGNAEEALRLARAAAAADPESWEGRVLEGEALLALGRIEPGLAALQAAVEKEDGHVWARSALAMAYYRLGRTDEAMAEYQTLLRYAPDFPSAQNNLGAIYLQTGRFLDAVAVFRSILDNHPNDDAAAGNLGSALFFLDRTDEAIEAYRRALELAPDQPLNYRNLGEAFEKAGRTEEAKDMFEAAVRKLDEALAAGGPRAELLGQKAFALAKLGRYEQASRAIEEGRQLDPNDVTLVYVDAQVDAMAGKRDEALRHLKEVVAAGYPREWVRRDPCFAPIQNDPEFVETLTASPEDLG